MAVMALLVVLIAQLTSNAAKVVTSGNKRLDVDRESRLIFTRLAQDVEGMALRPDADMFFVKNPGNDAFYFYSQSVGYFSGGEGPKTPFALVGYRIANRSSASALAPNGVLERVGIGLGYDNALTGKIMRFLTYPEATVAVPAPTPRPESTLAWTHGSSGNPDGGNKVGDGPSWDNPAYGAENQAPLSSQVFRLEFCFLMKDGTYFVPPAPGTSPWANAAYRAAIDRIKSDAVGLVVTIAVLDEKSQLLLPKTGTGAPDFSPAIAGLPDGDTPDVPAAWQNVVSSGGSALGMPDAVASQVRIYQRTFRLNR